MSQGDYINLTCPDDLLTLTRVIQGLQSRVTQLEQTNEVLRDKNTEYFENWTDALNQLSKLEKQNNS